ncbi:MAG: outer membrane lipoprotein chaperone LolA [Methylococcales bacterium]|nr:outer membrane lipoprotein chaperone LolA [Methylococcales bacterium]
MIFRVLSLVVLTALINPAWAQTPRQRLEQFFEQTQTLSAEFKQVLSDDQGDVLQTSHGRFYLHRPGNFKWLYLKPYHQEIIGHSGKVWFYDPDLEQVTVKTLNESMGATPALLLSGGINLDDYFNIEKSGRNDDWSWLKLSPKTDHASFQYVLIGLHHQQLAGMELYDNFGQVTRIEFSQIKLNPALPEDLFNFVPPEGVDVFGE